MTGMTAEHQAELRAAYPDAWSWPAFEWARMEQRRSIPATYKIATDLMVTREQLYEAAEIQLMLYNFIMYGQHPAPPKGTQGCKGSMIWVDEAAGWVDPAAAGRKAAEAALSPLPRYLRLDEGSPPMGRSWT